MAMKGITVKLPDATLKRLEQEARSSGRTIAAIIRERVEQQADAGASVYSVSRHVAGSLAGSDRAATNERRKFRGT